MNLDFGLEPLFSWYVVLLCLSGVVMVALAASSAGERSVGSRAFSGVAGLGFLGYGVYLGFIFGGGSYLMFFQAFILPALLVVNFVRALFANRQAQPQPYPEGPAQPYPGVPTQPYPGAPAQPQPYQPGFAQPQPYQPGRPAQPYQPQPYRPGPAQPYQAGPAQPQPYQAGPAQPQAYPTGPTQPGPTHPN